MIVRLVGPVGEAAVAPRPHPNRQTTPRKTGRPEPAGQAPRVLTTSEPRTKTDVEQLRLVERFFLDWQCQIDPDRADRRFPRDADAGAGPDRGRVLDARLPPAGSLQLRRREHEVLLIIAPQGAEIGENAPAYPQFLRQTERHPESQRSDIIFVAAERIAGNCVTRADTGRREAAQIVAADKEPVLQQYLLPAPAEDIAAFRGKAQHPFGEDRVVVTHVELVANILNTKTDSGKIVTDRSVIAARRFEPVVALVVEQHLADRRGQVSARLQLNEQRRVALDVGDIIRSPGVFPGLTQDVGNLIAGGQCPAVGELLVYRGNAGKEVGGRAGLHLEDVDAGSDVLVEEIRFGEAEVDLLRAEGHHGTDAQVLAASQKIALADTDIGERAVGGRETEAERQFAGRLFLDLDRDHGAIGRRAGAVVDLDLLEKSQILDAVLRARHLGGVEGVAFDQAKFAADHPVQRARVADDIDALDIDLGTLVDVEGQVDRVVFAVAGNLRLDLDKGVTAIAQRIGDHRNRVFQLLGVIPIV